MYIIKDPKKTIKRHHNQIRKRYSEDRNKKRELMKVIYDLFNIPMPVVDPEEKCSSKQKKTFLGTMKINMKRKNIFQK